MESRDALQAQAQELLTAGDIAGAARAFRHLGLAFPADKNAALAAAQGLRASGDLPGAAAVLEAALAYASKSPALLGGLAAAYAETGRHGEARAVLERLAAEFETKARASRDPDVWANLGNVRLQ